MIDAESVDVRCSANRQGMSRGIKAAARSWLCFGFVTWAFLSIASFQTLTAIAADKPAKESKRVQVSRFELSTQRDLLYANWILPHLKSDDVANWKWIGELVTQLGKWSATAIDAGKIASAIHHGLPVEGQQPLKKLDALVAECAETLGVPKPVVIVRNAPETTAYLVAAGNEHLLVLTSGLLNLFDQGRSSLTKTSGEIASKPPQRWSQPQALEPVNTAQARVSHK